MQQILISFGCGIAFAVGVVIGISVTMMAGAKARRDAIEHSKHVLAKLSENVACQARIAAAVEALAQIQESDAAMKDRSH